MHSQFRPVREMPLKTVLSLILALVVTALPERAAHAQCYPGLACPTDQPPATPPQKTVPGSASGASQGSSPQGAQGTGEYYYVGPVAPPDDWLSLRTVPSDKGGARVMKMPAGTLFHVREKRDPWWYVELRDGTTGWAHSNWIRCCKSGNE